MSTTSIHPLPVRVPLWLLVLPPFAVGFGYGAVLPALPAWLDALHTAARGASVPWHMGLLSTSYVVAAMLAAPVWGSWSDRVGRRRVLAIGLAGSAASTLLLWPAMNSLPALYVVRFVNGWFAASALPVTLALAADSVATEQRARVLAWINGGAVLGFLAGPAFGGALHALARAYAMTGGSVLHGMALPLVSAASVGSVILAVVWVLVPSDTTRVAPETRSVVGTLRTLLVSILLLGAFGALGLGVLEVGLAVFGVRGWGLSAGRLAVFYTVCSVFMVITQLLAFGRLAKHVDERWIVALSLAVMAGGFALLGMTVGRFAAALASVALIAASAGLLTPALSQLAARHGGSQVGAWAGWQNSAGNLGQALGSALAGALFTWMAFDAFFTVAVLLALAAIAAVWLAVGGPAHESPSQGPAL